MEALVAVRCVAGLGSAVVLVALALIAGGMKYEDKKRRGAVNGKQLVCLEKSRAEMWPRFRGSGGHRSSCCIQ